MHISIRPQLGHLFGLEESSLVQKANPYHDALGRFSTKSTATFVSAWAKTKPDLMHVPASDTTSYVMLDPDLGDTKAYKAMDTDNKAYIDGLPEAQKKAILEYTGSAYGSVNSYLRGEQDELDDINRGVMEDLGKALQGKTLGVDTQVFRGINPSPFAKKLVQMEEDGTLVGTSLQDPGFISASVSPGLASNWAGGGGVVLNMRVKKEQNAIYVGGTDHKSGKYTHYPNEKELILPRDTPMLVTKAEYVSGKLHITVDVLPPKPVKKSKRTA